MHTPKSWPAFFPEADSRIGTTMPSTVPGSTVLRIATTKYPSRAARAAPICWLTRFTSSVDKLPLELLGAATFATVGAGAGEGVGFVLVDSDAAVLLPEVVRASANELPPLGTVADEVVPGVAVPEGEEIVAGPEVWDEPRFCRSVAEK